MATNWQDDTTVTQHLSESAHGAATMQHIQVETSHSPNNINRFNTTNGNAEGAPAVYAPNINSAANTNMNNMNNPHQYSNVGSNITHVPAGVNTSIVVAPLSTRSNNSNINNNNCGQHSTTNSNIAVNNSNSNNNSQFGCLKNGKQVNIFICVLFIICVILDIIALSADILTYQSFEYYYYYSYEGCVIGYGMHQLHSLDCNLGTDSMKYSYFCGYAWLDDSWDLYCDLESKGDTYETNMVISLVFSILSLLLFYIAHMRKNQLFVGNNNSNNNNNNNHGNRYTLSSFRIFLFMMCLNFVAYIVALLGWTVNNDIHDHTAEYTDVTNVETTWGVSLWCTLIAIIVDIGIKFMVYQIVSNKLYDHNDIVESSVSRSNVMTPQNEAHGDEARSLNNRVTGKAIHDVQRTRYPNNGNNNNNIVYAQQSQQQQNF